MRRFHSLVLLALVSSSSATHQFNVTIHHTHSSISYWPPTSWTTLTTNDASELQISSCLQQRQQPSTFYPAPVEAEREILEGPRSFQITTGVTGPSKELDKWSADCRGGGGRGGECDVSDIMPRGHLDSSHWPIKFRFKFIGPSVSVFGFAVPSPLIDWPSTIGVTFAIDGEQFQTFAADSRHYSLPCSMNGPIFSHVGLSNDHEHELLVTISPSWKFFLNSITFTHSGVDLALPYPSISNPSSWISRKVLWPRTEEEGETTSTTDHSKKHNIATFAAAISSVVGVLAIISLIVIFSIIRRRRRARQRDLTEEQPPTDGNIIIPRIRAQRISSSTLNASSSTVFHTEASEDTPNPNFNLNAVVNHNNNNNNGAQMTMMVVEGPTRMTTGLVPRFFHTGTTVLLYSAAASEGRGRGEVPLSSEREEDGGVLPPPYELSVGVDSPSEINHLSIGREGDGGADEEGRDYTYADAPPPGTPPALPSRPPSPPPPLSSLSPSDSSPCSNPGNRIPPPPLPSPLTTQVPTPLPPPLSPLLSPPIRRTPSPAPSSLDSRGSPPGLN